MPRNAYPGICLCCGCKVPAGEGHFEKITSRTVLQFKPKGLWAVRCLACVGKKHIPQQARQAVSGDQPPY